MNPLSTAEQGADGVRRLMPSDIPALLTLVREEIPDMMAARLGPQFAERYHRALLEEPTLCIEGCFIGGELIGFIVYSHDAREALRCAFARHRLMFALSLSFALWSPTRLLYVVRIALAVLGGAGEAGAEVSAELLTIAVRRGLRGGGAMRETTGMNVPKLLISSAFDYLRARGIREVKVFCKPEEIEPIANGFVRKQGFEWRGRTTRYGIPTNLYVKVLDAPPA